MFPISGKVAAHRARGAQGGPVRRGGARLLAALVLGLAVQTAHAEHRAAAGFSESELAALKQGELVERPVDRSERTRKLFGGTSYQVIDAPVTVVWQALLDTQRYPRMMPEVVEARLVEEDAERRTVFLRQGREGLLQLRYYLDVRINAAQRDIEFKLDAGRPHELRDAFGFYNVRPFDGGKRTLLSYGVMADMGDGLLVRVVRDEVRDWMLRTPWMVKRFVEGSGRYIYGDGAIEQKGTVGAAPATPPAG